MDVAGDGELVHLLVSIGKQSAFTCISLINIHVTVVPLMKQN